MSGQGIYVRPIGAGTTTIVLRIRGNKSHDYEYYEAYVDVSVTDT